MCLLVLIFYGVPTKICSTGQGI
uniref:Uncharacterized protein n=1 Tax=Anguilla anguilla TaxID=7936 RepID=A0A0E9TG95_ANGAN